MASKPINVALKNVRPLLSLDFCEARRRAMGLYKAAFRYIPHMLMYLDIPKSEQQCRTKLRELFYRNAGVTDTRVIDLLVIKGYMELKEITESWMQKGSILNYWTPTREPMPKDFMSKFILGVD